MPKRKDRRRRFGAVVKRPREGGGHRYQARWTANGKRTERTFDTRDEAEEFLVELEKKAIVGQPAAVPTLREMENIEAARTGPKPTFVEYARKLYDERMSKTKAANTVALYGHNLAGLSAYFGERVVDGVRIPARRLDEITQRAVEGYGIWRKSHPRTTRGGRTSVGPATVNRDVAFLKQVLGEAVADGLLDENPLRGMKKLKEPRRQRRWLAPSEAARLIAACEPDFRAVVVTALYTGARKAELQGLTWADVNFESEKLGIFRPKNGTPDWIDLHPKVAAELGRLRDARPGVRPDEHVFLSSRGTPWQDFRYAWKKALKRAGLFGRIGLVFHSQRHTLAVHFLSQGGSVVDLQAQLGHADIATTMIYGAMTNETRRRAILRMDYGPPPEANGTADGEMGDRKGDWSVGEGGWREERWLVRCA